MKLKALIFDWAGTLIDLGSKAPVAAFVEVFADHGIEVSEAEARAPMGLPKRDHVVAMMAAIGHQGKGVSVDQVYQTFIPLSESVVARHADLILGALDTIEWARFHGLKIGTTTGCTRSIMDQVLPLVKAQGFEADFVVCSDEVSEGRPAPLGIYKNLIELGVHPTSQALKIDDTAPGIYEGLNAGCPTVGLTESGNSSAEDLSMANHLIGSVAELPALIEKYYG